MQLQAANVVSYAKLRVPPPPWEKAFGVLGLFFAMGGARILSLSSSENSDISPLSTYVSLLVYAISIALLALRYKRVLRFAFRDYALWVLLLLAVFSAAWSDVPGFTLWRSVAMLGTTAFGVYLGSRYSGSELFMLLCWTGVLVACLSLVACLVIPPPFGFTSNPDGSVRWRGVLSHANQLGRLMALTSVMWTLRLINGNSNRLVAVGALILGIALLFLSGSKSSLALILILMSLSFLGQVTKLRYTWAVPLFLMTILVFGGAMTWLASNFDGILASLGRDATLSGRIPLWENLFEMIDKRPWFGYGFQAFWLGDEGASRYVRRAVGWDVKGGHNGLVDLGLELGFFGVISLLISYGRNLTKATLSVYQNRFIEAILPLMILVFIFMSNMTEAGFFAPGYMWACYVAVSVQLSSTKYQSQ